MSEPLTFDEIEEKITPLLYTQRVNFEAATELAKEAGRHWRRFPEGHRLRAVTTSMPSGLRNVYESGWSKDHPNIFNRTAALHVLLKPDSWPEFNHAEEKLHPHIEIWTELIGLSEEAEATRLQVHDTGVAINNLRVSRSRESDPAQAFRGWYIRIGTSRRGTVGWVVGGRGKSISVLADPLALVEHLTFSPATYKMLRSGKAAVRAAAPRVFTPHPVWSQEPEKYSMTTASIDLLLPPDVATERKEWVDRVFATAKPYRDEAARVTEEYLKWQKDVQPIKDRQRKAQAWIDTLPKKDFAKEWKTNWTAGVSEAITVLTKVMSDEDIREAIIAEHRSRYPELMITEAEQLLAGSPPAGSDDFAASLAQIVTAKHSDLAPMF